MKSILAKAVVDAALFTPILGTKVFKYPQCSQKSESDFSSARNMLFKIRSILYGLDVESFTLGFLRNIVEH